MAEILYNGESPYNIPEFFRTLLAELPTKSGCDASQIKKVLDYATIASNSMVKQAAKPQKKGKAKPQLKNDRNNNPAMVANLMGGDSEEEPVAEEEGAGGREEEADYDFM
jgi:hypothetical protein